MTLALLFFVKITIVVLVRATTYIPACLHACRTGITLKTWLALLLFRTFQNN